jgi:hypothetical protein
MMEIRIDHSERERERRFKLLEGCKWDITKAREMWCWINSGLLPHEVDMLQPVVTITPEVGYGIERAGLCGSELGR